MSKASQHTTCKHCGHRYASTNYMQRNRVGTTTQVGQWEDTHTLRCKDATEEERAYWKEHGRWPRRKRCTVCDRYGHTVADHCRECGGLGHSAAYCDNLG